MKTHSSIGLALLGLLVFARADAAQAVTPPTTSISDQYAIWPGEAPDMTNPPTQEMVAGPAGDRSFSAISRPTVTAFFAANPSGAAVLVLPGGGYNKIVFDKEGTEIARWLNSLGVDAFVLKYRLLGETHNRNPAVGLQDAQRAIRLVREGRFSREVGHTVDPKRVGVIGFSAGGNLAAVLGTYYAEATYAPVDPSDALSARPDFMILGYAWMAVRSEMRTSMAFPRAHVFAEKVSADTPPAFIFAGDADTHVPFEHSRRAESQLRKAGVPVELHIFPGSPHGFGLRGTGPEKAWPDLCAAWLRARGVIPQ
jgi:acetyl esterase/lipase